MRKYLFLSESGRIFVKDRLRGGPAAADDVLTIAKLMNAVARFVEELEEILDAPDDSKEGA